MASDNHGGAMVVAEATESGINRCWPILTLSGRPCASTCLRILGLNGGRSGVCQWLTNRLRHNPGLRRWCYCCGSTASARHIGEIRHRFGDDIGVPEILRCAKEFGLKARTYRSNWRRLIKAPLPGIAVLRDGRCLLPVKAIEHAILVQNPLSPQPIIMSRAEFEAIWDGSLILMGPRAGLVDLSHRFGGRLGAIHKREMLGRVLAARAPH